MLRSQPIEMKRSLWIVEDDPSIRFGLVEVFEGEGYAVRVCERGDEVEAALAKGQPHLVILDVMLPGKNGFEICKGLRKRGDRVPILMLTSKGQELDKVVGLDCGADDYVTKPFGVRELVARVKALLRRVDGGAAGGKAGASKEIFSIGAPKIDPKTFEVSRKGAKESLTPKEMELLRFLDGRRGEVLSQDEILNAVWGIDYYGTTRTLDQCVAQLRKKIGAADGKPKYLQTVHGVGYKLV